MSTKRLATNVLFKKLTPESINNIKNRINNQEQSKINELTNARKRLKRRQKKVETLKDNILSSKNFLTGKILPERFKKYFPQNLHGIPIEEIDETRNNDYVRYKLHVI